MTHPTAPLFATTRWSLVKAAGAGGQGAALEELCRLYWFPVYAVVRRSGQPVEEAKDLTQGFFARLLEKRWLDGADDSRGRFRSFLLTALKRHLANEWHHQHAQKRGGFQEKVPLDEELAERLYLQEEQGRSPDEMFDRRWALVMLERAMVRLGEEYYAAGHVAEYERLLPSLTADRGETDYAALAAAMGGVTEGAARVAVHRLRKRFRAMVRAEIGRTVTAESDVDDEMAVLMQALGR
jgi:RNA polymerase sigma-70 factor (ECF subfamily)